MYAEGAYIHVSMEESNGDPAFAMHAAQVPFVTFIIPTIGRSTLQHTLESLHKMESKQWKAIVMYDGKFTPDENGKVIMPHAIEELKKQIDEEQQNIFLFEIGRKLGFQNCAAEVRNIAMSKADTPWVAFLDDDDEVTPDYMFRLQSEINSHKNADVIVFRMLIMNSVMPKGNFFSIHNVGISFAMKRNLFEKQKFTFEPSKCEDFTLLNKLQKQGKNIYVSPCVVYVVRPPPLP